MIDYNPGRWHVLFIFTCRGSVFPKALLWACPSGIAATAIWFLSRQYKIKADEKIGQIWSSYMFVLGFLIVFRSQQAYGRFWEGTTLLNQVRGEWFNAVSSLFAFCSDKAEKQTEVKIFQHLIVRLMSLLYCSALQQIATMEDEAFEILDISGISGDSMNFLMSHDQRCEILLQWIQKLICMNIGTGVIPIAPPILSRVFQELSRGIVGVNNATKISDILFPFPYAQMVTVMLLITAFVTPWVAGTIMQTPGWAGGLTFISVFAFVSINYIAAEIELPFGDDPNDLPIADYQRKMNRDLMLLMMEHTQNPPSFTPLTPLNEPCGIIMMREDVIDQMLTDDGKANGAPARIWQSMIMTSASPPALLNKRHSITILADEPSGGDSGRQPCTKSTEPSALVSPTLAADNSQQADVQRNIATTTPEVHWTGPGPGQNRGVEGHSFPSASSEDYRHRGAPNGGPSQALSTQAGQVQLRLDASDDYRHRGTPIGGSPEALSTQSGQVQLRLDATLQMSSEFHTNDSKMTRSPSPDRTPTSPLWGLSQPQPAVVPNPSLML